MKKFKYLLLLIFFVIPFKTFALEDNDHYFNLTIPENYYSDITSVKFGGNTTMFDFIEELKSYNPIYRNISVIIYYSGTSFNTLDVFLHPLNSVASIGIYGESSTNNRELIYQTLYFSSNSIRLRFSSTTDPTSVLDSEIIKSIKACMEENTCPSAKPTESTYTGTYSFSSSSGSLANSSYRIENFDSSLDYDIPLVNFLYYSNLHYTLIKPTNTAYLVRTLKYNSMNLEYYNNFPTYLQYLDQSDDPDDPDNPIDTNVGVWKNKVIWFVDNNSEYGVLVNLYILIFISVILLSFICFIKLIRKNRW